MKKEIAIMTEEKTISELLCEPNLEIEVYEETASDEFHEFVYRQIDLVAVISAFNAVLLKQEWLKDKGEGFLPTTSRRYSARYLKGVKIKEAGHGSLFLNIVGSVASGLILMLIQETYKKKHPNEEKSAIQINVKYDNCSFIALNGNHVSVLHANSVTRNALRITSDLESNELDARAFIEGILDKVNVDDDLEGNIRRCIDVLHDEGIISVSPVYNSKGVRTLVNCSGRLFDCKV